MTKFTAEIKKVAATKTASNDRHFTVTLVTDNPAVLQLGATDPNSTVEVTVQ